MKRIGIALFILVCAAGLFWLLSPAPARSQDVVGFHLPGLQMEIQVWAKDYKEKDCGVYFEAANNQWNAKQPNYNLLMSGTDLFWACEEMNSQIIKEMEIHEK